MAKEFVLETACRLAFLNRGKALHLAETTEDVNARATMTFVEALNALGITLRLMT